MREAPASVSTMAPRSQMMCCIDFPTMLKKGSGWGAIAGISAAQPSALGRQLGSTDARRQGAVEDDNP